MHVSFLNLIIEHYSPVSGGALATVINEQAQRLHRRGHQVSVLTGLHGSESYPFPQVIPLRTGKRETLPLLKRAFSRVSNRFHHWDWPYYEYYLASYKRALRKLQPDAVITFNDLVAPRYVREMLPDARIIATLHNELRTGYRNIEAALDSVDYFAPVSDYIRNWTQRNYALPDEKMQVILNGCDPEMFHPRPDYLRPRGQLRVLFIGRLIPEKGPDIVADAIAKLRDEGLPVTLSVAGAVWWHGFENQTKDPFVQKMAVKLKAAGAEYLGHVPRSRVANLVREHDVVCVLSRWNEPFGLVALEGMASGCAVVASNRGGLPEACGDAALLVDPEDFPAVVSKLRALATNPELLIAQKQKALAHARDVNWDRNVEMLECLLLA